MCFQTKDNRRTKTAAKIKAKSVKGADDTVVALVVTVLT